MGRSGCSGKHALAYCPGCFPGIVQLHRPAVFIDRAAVVVKHRGILGAVADGVVQTAGELGEVLERATC